MQVRAKGFHIFYEQIKTYDDVKSEMSIIIIYKFWSLIEL